MRKSEFPFILRWIPANFESRQNKIFNLNDKVFKFVSWSLTVAVLRRIADANGSSTFKVLWIVLFGLILFWLIELYCTLVFRLVHLKADANRFWTEVGFHLGLFLMLAGLIASAELFSSFIDRVVSVQIGR